MDRKKYNQLRAVIAIFVCTIVAMAAVENSYLLATVGVLTGMVFMVLVRTKVNIIKTDEREKTIREKAAQMAYAIFAPTLGIGALILLIPSYGGFLAFSKGDFTYLESLGVVFAYQALFLIAIYAISYHFLNRKYGGGGNEE
jgi:uncharacterized membrane protein